MVSSVANHYTELAGGARVLGSIQVAGPVRRREEFPDMPLINGATLHELTRALIPIDFQGKVLVYVHIAEIIESPKEPGAE